jgi:long-chain acyl-CoA synthetase
MPEQELLRQLRQSRASKVVLDAGTGRWFTRGEIADQVSATAESLRFQKKALGFLYPFNEVESLIAYLASLQAGHAIVMLDPEMDSGFKARLTDLFEPDFIIGPAGELGKGLRHYALEALPESQLDFRRSRDPHRHPIHPDLTLLISTSGSTGSAKLVRLTARNMEASATAISAELRHNDSECNILTAPIYNAYGQSVVHTALLSGGRFVLTQARLVSGEFWDTVRRAQCNCIGGTPYFYQVLDRLDLEWLDVPLLMKFIQTGGRLSEDLVRKFHQLISRRGGRLHIMYGQAEATARICGLPPEFLPDAARSVGRPLRGFRLWIESEEGRVCAPMEEGELTLEGPNVMMGYASQASDLGAGDQMGGRLSTGDLGYHDERGLFYITGRKARFAKVFGWRVSLDDVEELLTVSAPVAATSEGDRVVVYCEDHSLDMAPLLAKLAERLRIHPSGFAWRAIKEIPRLSNGKTDYRALTQGSMRE